MTSFHNATIKVEEPKKMPVAQGSESDKANIASLVTLANERFIGMFLDVLRLEKFDNVNEILPSDYALKQIKPCNILRLLQLKETKAKKLRKVSQKLVTLREKREATIRTALEVCAPIIPNGVSLPNAKIFDELFEAKVDSQSSILEIKTHHLANLQNRIDREKTKFQHYFSSTNGEKKIVDTSETAMTESSITDSLREWKLSQLGDISFPDDSHCLLDISKSARFSTVPLSSRCCTRIRARLREPTNSRPFSLDEVHPLNSDFETMDLANTASSSSVLSLVPNNLLWQQVDHKSSALL